MASPALYRRARRLWAEFEAVVGIDAARTLQSVYRSYGSPSRAYHGRAHVIDVVERVSILSRGLPPQTRAALLAAAWYHDVVYDSRRGDNEEKSAALLLRDLRRAGVDDRTTRKAAELIMETKRHSPGHLDRAGQILVDADLAVLSALPTKYDRYAAGIRTEYAWVPISQYREGRAKVLRTLIHRSYIYQTARMRRLDAAARANVEREIAQVDDTSLPIREGEVIFIQ